MNKIKTQNMADRLRALGAIDLDSSSNILWHAHIPYIGPMEFKNAKKETIKVLQPFFYIHFIAETNVNGVGDGKKPGIALTYQLDFYLTVSLREYKKKIAYNCEYYKFYDYSRDIDDLFATFLKTVIKI